MSNTAPSTQSTEDRFTLVNLSTSEATESADQTLPLAMSASSLLPGTAQPNKKKPKSVAFGADTAPPATRPDLTESRLLRHNTATQPGTSRTDTVARVLAEGTWQATLTEYSVARADPGSSRGPGTEASSESFVWVPRTGGTDDDVAAAGLWADIAFERPANLVFDQE